MSKRPVSVRMDSVKARIEGLKNQQKQLENEQKQQERKARTRRLCSRAGLLESMLPETINLTDEQFKLFLEKTVANNFGRDKLKEVTAQPTAAPPLKTAAQDGEKPTPKATETAGHTNAPPPPKTANTAHNGGTGDRANGGDNERQNG